MLKKWPIIFFVLSLSTPIPSLGQNSVEMPQSICPDMSDDGAENSHSNDAFATVLDAICDAVQNKNNAAVTANMIAETARVKAVAADSTAETARVKAVAADNTAETARVKAVAADNTAETARVKAENKQNFAKFVQGEVLKTKIIFDNLLSENSQFVNYFDTTTSASDPKIEVTLEGQNYLNSLMDIHGIISTEPPATLSRLIGIQKDHNAKVVVADNARQEAEEAQIDAMTKATTAATAATVATAANDAKTEADNVATAANVAKTEADNVATAANVAKTEADNVATAANVAVYVGGSVGSSFNAATAAEADAAEAAEAANVAKTAIRSDALKVVMAEKDSPGVSDALETINTVLKNKDIKVAETKANDAETKANDATEAAKKLDTAVDTLKDPKTQELTKKEILKAEAAEVAAETKAAEATKAAANIPKPKPIKEEAFLEYLVFLEYLNSLQTNTNDIPVEEITNLIADEKSSDSENIHQVNSTQLSSVSSRLSSLRHGLVSLSYNNNDRLSHPLPSLASTAGVTQAFKKVQFNHRTTELSRERGGAAGDDELPSGNSRWGVYVTGMYGRGDKDVPNKSSEGFEFDAKNFTIGADYLLDVSTIVGLAMGYGSAGINYSNDRGSFDIDTNTVSVYGSRYINNSWFLDGVIGLGSSHYTSSRAIRYSVKDGDNSVKEKTQTTKAAPKGDQLLLSLGASKTITITTKSTIDWDFSARVNYLEAKINGYTETSDVPKMEPDLSAEIGDLTIKSISSDLGFSVSSAFSSDFGVVVPNFGLSWIHEFERGSDRKVRTRFAHDPNSVGCINDNDRTIERCIVIPLEANDRNYGQMKLGVSVLLPHGLTWDIRVNKILGVEDINYEYYSLSVRKDF